MVRFCQRVAVSGYYAVCRFNGAALTHVLPDGKTARKTVCRLREFAGGKLAELWCEEKGKRVFCRYWRQPEFVQTLQRHDFHFFAGLMKFIQEGRCCLYHLLLVRSVL